MKSGFGVLFATVPRYRRPLIPDEFNALNRLNTSAIASTRAVPISRNAFETRRFNDDSGAPRPQLIVAHGPRSFMIGLWLLSNPVNANPSVAMSVLFPF